MPTAPNLPTVDAQPVRPSAYSSPNVAPFQDPTPGALQDQARAIQRTGQQIEDVAARLRAEQEAAEALELDNLQSEQDREEMTKFRALKGRGAVEGFESFLKSVNDRRQALLSQAKSPGQLDVLRRSSAQRADEMRRMGRAWRDQQFQTWREGSVSAGLEASVRDAIELGDSPERERHIGTARLRARELGDLMGHSDEQKAQLWAETQNRIHAGRLDSLIAQQRTGEALQYFEANQAQMLPESRDRARRVVVNGGLRDQSLRLTDDLWKMTGGETAAAAELNRRFLAGEVSAELVDATMPRLAHRDRLEREAIATQQLATITEAEQWLAANPARMLQDNPDLYERVGRTGRLPQLLQFERSGRYTTNQETVQALESMTSEQLAAIPEKQFFAMTQGNLSPAMQAIWSARYRRATSKATAIDQTLLSINDRLQNVAKSLGIDEKSDEYSRMVEDADRRLVSMHRILGRELRPDEIQRDVLDPLVKDVAMIDDWFGDSRMPLFMASPAQKQAAYYVPTGGGDPVYLRDMVSIDTLNTQQQVLMPDAQTTVATLKALMDSGQMPARPITWQMVADGVAKLRLRQKLAPPIVPPSFPVMSEQPK